MVLTYYIYFMIYAIKLNMVSKQASEPQDAVNNDLC